jgi:DNA-binding transcriptional MerR regulator
MKEQQFKIGKLAQELGIKRFVIRFWEKEFGIRSQRTSGGQRFYQYGDFEQFKLIKELLYEKGFTISGAKKILNQKIKKTVPIIEDIKFDDVKNKALTAHEPLSGKILALQKQLIKLRNLL